MNGAMVEVSGKTQHLGLAGYAWAQGPDVCSLDGWNLENGYRAAKKRVGVFGCLKEPAAPGLVGL